MSQSKNIARYDSTTMAFHWITAVLVLTMVVLGFGRGFVSRDFGHTLMNWHRSIGIFLLAVVSLRLLWRVSFAKKIPFPPMARGLKFLAGSVHYLLYAMLFFMIGTGWAMTSAKGQDVTILGLFSLPHLMAENKDLGHTLEDIHVYGIYILLGLISLHVGGGLYHHFILKDGLLYRMMPKRKER